MRLPALASLMLCLAFILGLGGCSGSTPPLARTSADTPEYRLGAGDNLQITVFGEEALSREYAVTSAGDIAFPLLGDIPVNGKSVQDLSETLTAQLGAGYVNDPRVSIEVLNYRPFYILGEVTKSGEYPYRAGLSALQAIAVAGGYTYRADKRQVFIRRDGETQERTYLLGDANPIWVMPGDTVRIGERFF